MTDQPTAVRPPETQPDRKPAPRVRAPRPDRSAARDFKPGFIAKLALMALVNALGLYGILAAAGVQSWLIVTFLVIGLIVANYVYFSRRAVPLKYLVPGLTFLLVYQIFTMFYTGYIAFTNYGDGHILDKQEAIAAIELQTEKRLEGSASYPLTVLSGDDGLAFAIVRDGVPLVGDADTPLEPTNDATVDGTKVTAVPGYDVLNFAQVAQQQAAVTGMRVAFSDDMGGGSLRTQDASNGYVYAPTLNYNAATDTFTNLETGTVYSPNDRGNFVSADGEVLTPGWQVSVGFDNFTKMFTDSRISGAFFQIALWTFAFAFLSVATTFILGLALALVFNDPRIRGRKIYRALMILPYAFPGFLAALVWKGMLNERFGFINEVIFQGADIPWLNDPWLAKFAVLGVNLWLGFPYMFLICTGALQAIPNDVIESSKLDGAGPFRVVSKIIFPLLLISVAPLLISSFAFNFNNFTLIYMLTGGGPNFPGSPLIIGSTDLLISMVYSVAFESGVKQYGLAAAVSILIFIFVGLISWLGFRRTRQLEEL